MAGKPACESARLRSCSCRKVPPLNLSWVVDHRGSSSSFNAPHFTLHYSELLRINHRGTCGSCGLCLSCCVMNQAESVSFLAQTSRFIQRHKNYFRSLTANVLGSHSKKCTANTNTHSTTTTASTTTTTTITTTTTTTTTSTTAATILLLLLQPLVQLLQLLLVQLLQFLLLNYHYQYYYYYNYYYHNYY